MGGNSLAREFPAALRLLAVVAGITCLLLMSGCTGLGRKPSQCDETASERAATGTPSMTAPAPTEEEPKRLPESDAGATATAPPALQGEQDKAIQETAPDRRVTKVEPAAVIPPAPAPVAPAPKRETGQGEKPVTPPLDLELLEKRLKETSAIGIFTKLALKNQVDDLLDKFRAFYQGHSTASLAQLRQAYEMLIMKVLAILQDDDPLLARDLLDSREAIWEVLTDPEQFATL